MAFCVISRVLGYFFRFRYVWRDPQVGISEEAGAIMRFWGLRFSSGVPVRNKGWEIQGSEFRGLSLRDYCRIGTRGFGFSDDEGSALRAWRFATWKAWLPKIIAYTQ